MTRAACPDAVPLLDTLLRLAGPSRPVWLAADGTLTVGPELPRCHDCGERAEPERSRCRGCGEKAARATAARRVRRP